MKKPILLITTVLLWVIFNVSPLLADAVIESEKEQVIAEKASQKDSKNILVDLQTDKTGMISNHEMVTRPIAKLQAAKLQDIWVSTDPNDMTPIKGTQWEFTFTIGSTTFVDTLTFGSTVLYASDGTVGLSAVNQYGYPGAVIYTEMVTGGGYGFAALIQGSTLDELYNFQVSGSNATGYYFFQNRSSGYVSNIYSMTGTCTNCSPVTTTKEYYMPLFKPQPDYQVGLGITNLNTSSAAAVTVKIYAKSGTLQTTENKTIPAGGQTSFITGASLTSDGWIKVESDQDLAGLNFLWLNYGSGSSSYLADIPFTHELLTSLVIPHVAQHEKWDTLIFIANPNSSPASVTMIYKDPSGTASPAYTLTLPANGSQVIPTGSVAGSSSVKGGSVRITSTNGLTAFALYYNLKTGNYSYTGINAVKGN